jgi:hypothetical protein
MHFCFMAILSASPRRGEVRPSLPLFWTFWNESLKLINTQRFLAFFTHWLVNLIARQHNALIPNAVNSMLSG